MVLQIRPDHAGAHYYYSLIHLSAKNWLEARKSAQAALRESQFGEPWASKASLIIAGCHARITADARKPQDKKAE